MSFRRRRFLDTGSVASAGPHGDIPVPMLIGSADRIAHAASRGEIRAHPSGGKIAATFGTRPVRGDARR